MDLPEVEEIGDNAFSGCSSLRSINLGIEKYGIDGAPWGSPRGYLIVHWDAL